MKNKIHPFFLWLMIALMILTVFLGFAACTALDQLETARQKTEQEQINLLEQMEFHLTPDAAITDPSTEKNTEKKLKKIKEKIQQ